VDEEISIADLNLEFLTSKEVDTKLQRRLDSCLSSCFLGRVRISLDF